MRTFPNGWVGGGGDQEFGRPLDELQGRVTRSLPATALADTKTFSDTRKIVVLWPAVVESRTKAGTAQASVCAEVGGVVT